MRSPFVFGVTSKLTDIDFVFSMDDRHDPLPETLMVSEARRYPFSVRRISVLGVALWIGISLENPVHAQQKRALEFQYESGDIRVPIPSADEPRVTSFGETSVKAAVAYLEDGAVSWVRERTCVNCHTTGPYMTERPALSPLFGPPSQEVRDNFAQSVPKEITTLTPTDKNGHVYYPGTFTSVWRALGLAVWDQHLSESTTEPTDRALRDMFAHQSEDGSFVTHGEVEIPHITTDFELSLQAARAITAAPGWLDKLSDQDLRARVDRLKEWFSTAEPANDFDRILKLQLASYLPDVVSEDERQAAMAILTARQHEDGGWSTRDLSAVNDWHFEMSDTVVNLITSLPDAASPESDAYMTALAVVLLRQSGVAASDDRIQRGLTWLKREQRESGRWWMHSLYRGNYHFTTYIATAEALKALSLCDELHKPTTK
ncbi:MAG: prenyltransferase/squalene oxidase repeat-containing protein [Planctomycetaceae bacterium]